ncbi:TetR/AcrR family transcriptional regulator [Klenkia marina]|uniref:TetR/AcrR family transcriptional regulator n=1 Tax=Klenkia marina TaxID=1960309 RepID=UPI00105A0D08|nr:TetR/AcrR family transcriptional regulator [Klenkia marina]
MAERDWRAQKRDSTRARLTAAAFALFDERGYSSVSVGDIAHGAGVSVPTFYAYFRTKEHVVLPDQDLDWIAGHLAAQPPDLPLPEQLRLGLRTLVAGLTREQEELALRRWRYVQADPGLQMRAAERENHSARVVVAELGVDPATPAGSAIVVVVVACLRAATAAMVRWAAADGRHPLPDLVDEAFAALRSM